jgi:hypothetical protein
MLIKQIILLCLLAIVLGVVIWYYLGLFSLMFSNNKKAVYVPSFGKDLSLMLAFLKLPADKTIMDL